MCNRAGGIVRHWYIWGLRVGGCLEGVGINIGLVTFCLICKAR